MTHLLVDAEVVDVLLGGIDKHGQRVHIGLRLCNFIVIISEMACTHRKLDSRGQRNRQSVRWELQQALVSDVTERQHSKLCKSAQLRSRVTFPKNLM